MFGACTMTHDQTYLFLSHSVFVLYKYIYGNYKFVGKSLHIQLSSRDAIFEGL